MEPSLNAGDLVIFDRRRDLLQVGVIAIFPDSIHRIVWLTSDGRLWERGDNVIGPARERTLDEVEGVAIEGESCGQWQKLRAMSVAELLRLDLRCRVRMLGARVKNRARRLRSGASK